MKTFKIKTHRPGAHYKTPHFFILNKGNNTGRPSYGPVSNSFVVFANSKEENEQLYWICNILFTGQYFKPRLVGSVIPFIHIGQIHYLLKKATKNYDGYHWNGRFKALKKLQNISEYLKYQEKCLKEHQIALMQSYNLDRD
ncbi:hypothetical protein K8089_15920 [Aequorivita sp. F47161]|jgi:hypothetical protein|uniref:Uncharacterized protein n=2 Tax=Aequorivita TaxID=153265 RepID=A0A9X1R1M4_9FLAO|nr:MULTISPECIES: hypothetical protein [Aequorivita]MCG2420509.1 hypothetical protein [Aequorivita vitellina]WGF91705.1 hypothetical protein QCQ61_10845 [Aequorivita sp. Ant34-E75]